MLKPGADIRTTDDAELQLPSLASLEALVVSTTKETLKITRDNDNHETKIDGSLVTEVDLELQSRLRAKLQGSWPQFGFIGEEMEYEDQVAEADNASPGYWVLDPLDGTTNYTPSVFLKADQHYRAPVGLKESCAMKSVLRCLRLVLSQHLNNQ